MRYISISGPVAAGKTTLLNRLLSHYGDRAAAHEERPQDNPFIREYYSDSSRWSFHSQITFLALYFDHPEQYKVDKDFFFFDRCFIENLVLARYRLRAGDLTRDEYDVIEKIAHGIDPSMPAIDKYIYLDCSVPLLCEHLAHRGREYEAALGREYAELQKELYDEWVAALPQDKVLFVNVDRGIDLDGIIAFIEN